MRHVIINYIATMAALLVFILQTAPEQTAIPAKTFAFAVGAFALSKLLGELIAHPATGG